MAASGLGVGDIVVINNVDYEISAINPGNAQDNSGGPGAEVAELNDTMDLIANANVNGSNTAPAFAAPLIGLEVGEQKLVRVNVTANLIAPASIGTADFTLTVNKGTGVTETTAAAITTQWNPLPTITITKEVRNVTAGTVAFAATTNGDPGDILEYRLTIQNAGSTAEAVVVTDPVPVYTTLQTFTAGTGYPNPAVLDATAGDGAGAATDRFAYVSDNDGPALFTQLTMQNSDDESTNLASGDAAGTAAGDTLSIYLGRDQIPSNTGPTVGGDIADFGTTAADRFYVYYRVRINP